MTLHAQAGSCCQNKNAERDQHMNAETSCCGAGLAQSPLPAATNEGCCGTTLGGGEVSRSNGAGEVRGLGKELPLVAGRAEGGMPSGCGCGPHGDVADAREDRQSPLGVNLLDGTPLNVDVRDDVTNVKPVVVNTQDGSPECCPGGEAEGCCQGQTAKQGDTVAENGCFCNGENDPGHHTEHATESGTKHRHGLHSVTEVTR